MSAEHFYDTNILLYAYDLDAGRKRQVAMALLEEAWRTPMAAAVSVQFLQEFQVNFLRSGHSQAEANRLVDDFSHWLVVDNSLSLFRLGIAVQERWQLSLWDAMIIAAAQVSGAGILYTEDLSHGQDYGGVQAVNPFLA